MATSKVKPSQSISGNTGKGTQSSKTGKVGMKKSIGKGQMGPKRTQKVTKSRNELVGGITKGDIRRVARRGGVKRVSTGIYPCTRDVLKSWLESVVKDALCFMEHAKRNTVFASDVVYALKRRGQHMYGAEIY